MTRRQTGLGETKPKPMTKKEIEAEAKFADEAYKDRARINRKFEQILKAKIAPQSCKV